MLGSLRDRIRNDEIRSKKVVRTGVSVNYVALEKVKNIKLLCEDKSNRIELKINRNSTTNLPHKIISNEVTLRE